MDMVGVNTQNVKGGKNNIPIISGLQLLKSRSICEIT